MQAWSIIIVPNPTQPKSYNYLTRIGDALIIFRKHGIPTNIKKLKENNNAYKVRKDISDILISYSPFNKLSLTKLILEFFRKIQKGG